MFCQFLLCLNLREESREVLDLVVEHFPDDPRGYYFRGCTCKYTPFQEEQARKDYARHLGLLDGAFGDSMGKFYQELSEGSEVKSLVEESVYLGPEHFYHVYGDLNSILVDVSFLLGKGGFGSVYRVQNRITGRRMAMKVLKSFSVSDIENQYLEYKIYETIQLEVIHQNIVRVEDLFIFESRQTNPSGEREYVVIFTMDLAESTLDQVIK